MPRPTGRRFASTSKAAERAGCTPRAVQNLIKSGEIIGYRLGKDYRVDLDELDLYMARDAIRREAEADPPLSDNARARLATLLGGVKGGDGLEIAN
jgi:excisionase family DNA binding protein